MSDYSKYMKYKKKYLDYKQLLINNNNIKMVGGKSLIYAWVGKWTPPNTTMNGNKYTYTGNFKGSIIYQSEFLEPRASYYECDKFTSKDKIDITGTWEGELLTDGSFKGSFIGKNKNTDILDGNYHWERAKWNLLDTGENATESKFIRPPIIIKEENNDTFTIYTTGISNWLNANDSITDDNESSIILKKWTAEDGILENILKIIPKKYTKINIFHSDILTRNDGEVPNTGNEINQISNKIKDYITNNDIQNKNNKIINSIFTTDKLNWDNIETKPKNSYIIIDFAHIFNNIGKHTVIDQISKDKGIDPISGKPLVGTFSESALKELYEFKLNSIYIGYPGDPFDYIYKSGLLFKVNDNNIETYIDYIFKRKLYTGIIEKEDFIKSPTLIFEKMIQEVKKKLYVKYTESSDKDKMDLVLKNNNTVFGKFIMNRLIKYNDIYEIQNLAVDGFTSNNMINGGSTGISSKSRKKANDPIPNDTGSFNPLTYLENNLFDTKIITENNSYAIISIGGNDIRHILGSIARDLGTTIAKFHSNYTEIIGKIKKCCNKIIIMTQYRPDINNDYHYKVYSSMESLPPSDITPIQKMNHLMEFQLYPEIFKLARLHNIPIADMSKTFNYNNSSLYVSQIEPSASGSQTISSLLSHILYNHDFINGKSILYSEYKNKIKTLNNNDGFVWGLTEFVK